MTVHDLQQFVSSLAVPLAAAGAKKAADDLRLTVAGIEPFKDLTIPQFNDFLAKAESYARTGILPMTSSGRAKKPAAGASGPEKVREASQRVLALYERAIDPELQYSAIDAEIKSLERGLSKDEAIEVAREIGIAKSLKTKKAALEEIARKIKDRKESHERTQFGNMPEAATSS